MDANTMLGRAMQKLLDMTDEVSGKVVDFLERVASWTDGEWAEFGKFLRKEICWLPVGAELVYQMLTIDRSKPFDTAFIGPNWSIWKGPANGNGLEGEEDQDTRSLVLTEIALGAIILDASFKKSETVTTGEERLKRLLESGQIRLDAAVFLHLWENKHLIPEKWKGKFVFFDGTILRNPYGDRYALCLYWSGVAWCWGVFWLAHARYATHPSAVLASPSALAA